MRIALFWAMTQRLVVIPYRSFGTTYRSQLQGSSIQVQSYLLRGKSLARRQEICEIKSSFQLRSVHLASVYLTEGGGASFSTSQIFWVIGSRKYTFREHVMFTIPVCKAVL